jgi:hypothetical protein
MIRMIRIDEPSRLLTEHLLLEMTMEKGIGDIHLVYWPAARDRKLEDHKNGARFDNRRKGVMEVDAFALPETVNHPTRLVTIMSTIRTKLVLEDPLLGDALACPRHRTSCHVLLHCRAANSSCIAASHEGSRSAALAKAGSGDGAEVEAMQTNSSVGYRVDGREIPARARVTGLAPAGGGGSVGGVPVDEASPDAALEGDVNEEEDGEAAPESKLEGDAVPPEATLEGGESDRVGTRGRHGGGPRHSGQGKHTARRGIAGG